MPTPLIFPDLAAFFICIASDAKLSLASVLFFLETAIKLRYNARNIAKFKQIQVTIGRSLVEFRVT